MKTLFLILALLFAGQVTSAQQNQEKPKTEQVKTEYTYPYKGKMVPVYKGPKGGYYINCVSSKTGNPYKRYLKIEQIKAKQQPTGAAIKRH